MRYGTMQTRWLALFVLSTTMVGSPALSQEQIVPATSAATPTVSKDPIAFHPEDLNPAFKLGTDDIDKAIRKGQDLAKKGTSIFDVCKGNTQMPVGVKGEKGKSHESVVICDTLNGLDLTLRAYKSTNDYMPLPERPISDFFNKTMHFLVSLQSVPMVASNAYGRNRLASVADVTVTNFVITDDKGDVIRPFETSSGDGVQTGDVDFHGVHRLDHTDTSQSDASSTVNAYDSNGDFATANGSATRTTTYNWSQYIPFSESHPYYAATYTVIFPLFDEDGKPLIKSDVKSMTLHIITPNGEKQVVYQLMPPKI